MTQSYNHIIKAVLVAIIMTIISADMAHAQLQPQKQFEPFLTRGKTTWSVNTGVRINTFEWNIASDTTGTATPNILSELTWRDLVMLEVNGEVRHEEPMDIGRLKGGLHLEANVNGGTAIDGENQDSDFNGDNRTAEFSRTIADASGGYAVGGSAAVGYKFYMTGDPTRRAENILKSKRAQTASGRARQARAIRQAMHNATPVVTMTPLIGYAVDQHDYRMKSVDQVIPANGPIGIDDFDWHYLSTWYGPFVGLEAEIKGKKNMLRLRGEYHETEFYGEGFWRGRAGFRQDPSYVQEASGNGYLINAEYAHALGEDYALTVDGTYKIREATDGTDKTFFVTNNSGAVRLNEVNDESISMHLGVRYNW